MRDQQFLIVQGLHDRGERPDIEKRGEDLLNTVLDLEGGTFDDLPLRSSDQSHRKSQSQRAATGLAEKPRRQSGLDRAELPLGHLALEPEMEATVDRGGVIDTIAVTDQAMAVSAEVEKLIPVGGVARQPGDIVREDDPDLIGRHSGDKFLEALATIAATVGSSRIGVDGLDGLIVPTALTSPLIKGVLDTAALVTAKGLMSHDDECLTPVVEGGDKLASAHG